MRGLYFNADNFKQFIRKILSGPKPNCISYIKSNTATLPINVDFKMTNYISCQNGAIDDCAKDGGEEFFTKMHCVFNRIPIESLKIYNSNAMHLGKKKPLRHL